MKKIFILLGMLLLGIFTYAKEDDILGTWIIEESGQVVEIYKTEDGKYSGKFKENNFIFLKQAGELSYDKEKNFIEPFTVKFPNARISYHTWINIQKDGSLLLKGTGNTEVGKYVGEWYLIRKK